MQIPKSLLIICMAALGVSSLHAQRTDSDVQAKAREQLRQKLSESQAQPSPAPSPVPEVKPAAVVTPPVQEPAPQPAVEVKTVAAAPVAVTPVTESGKSVPVYSALEPEQDAKAREALRLKMQELKAQDKVVTETVVTPIQPKVTTEPVQPNVATKPKPAKTEKPKAVQVIPAEPKKTTKVATTANNDASFTVTEVVPAPALNSKDAKLADLLQQYKADKITPSEYHTQRAKILSEP